MSDIFSFPPIFHSGLSRFKLLFLYIKYVFRNRSRTCYDDTLTLCVRAKMAALRFSSVHLLTFLLLPLQVHLASDSQLVIKIQIVLSKRVFAEYSPVISGLAAKHPDLSKAPKRPVNGWIPYQTKSMGMISGKSWAIYGPYVEMEWKGWVTIWN